MTGFILGYFIRTLKKNETSGLIDPEGEKSISIIKKISENKTRNTSVSPFFHQYVLIEWKIRF